MASIETARRLAESMVTGKDNLYCIKTNHTDTKLDIYRMMVPILFLFNINYSSRKLIQKSLRGSNNQHVYSDLTERYGQNTWAIVLNSIDRISNVYCHQLAA